MGKVMRAIGLMSGTSMDGIDLAILDTDGEDHVRRGPVASAPYPDDFRDRLRQATVDARSITRRDERPGILAAVERELTERHAEAVLRFMGDHALQPSAVDVLGFHGQTVLHRPPSDGGPGMLTVQLGLGELLAARTGIDVVYDLRAADCAAGGQGAPLVPVYHRALMAREPRRPLAVLNIGGVANVTWIGHDGTLVAFDTGPGNALIDDWMLAHTGEAMDRDGATAARGTIDFPALIALMRHPYFARPAPKSLDRNAFDQAPVDRLDLADGAATLTAFTAHAIALAHRQFQDPPVRWIVCGGGRRNATLMAAIGGAVEDAEVVAAEDAGLAGDSIEAEAWAYLAVRALRQLPITFPGTTGVAAPMTGGVLARAT